MPIYEHRCECGRETTTSRPMNADTMSKFCPECGEAMQRLWSAPAVHRFVEHFSQATGQEVGSQRQFREQLKRASEEATIRTGIPHNYVPVDLRDKAATGVTDAGMEATHKAHRDQGITQPTKTIFTP